MPNIEFRQSAYDYEVWDDDYKIVDRQDHDSLNRVMKNLIYVVDDEEKYFLEILWRFVYSRVDKSWKAEIENLDMHDHMWDQISPNSSEAEMIEAMLKLYFKPEYDEKELSKRLNDAIKLKIAAKENELKRLKSLVIA